MLLAEKQLTEKEKEQLQKFKDKFSNLSKKKEKLKIKLKKLDLEYMELQIQFFETFEKEILKNINKATDRLVFDLDLGFLFVEESGELKL